MSGPKLQEQGCTPEPSGAVWEVGASLFAAPWERVSVLGSKEGR